jgi:hypothetical protein
MDIAQILFMAGCLASSAYLKDSSKSLDFHLYVSASSSTSYVCSQLVLDLEARRSEGLGSLLFLTL